MSPLVSIILPNYNHCEFLKKRIESILEQTYQNFELIILDDASQDGSLRVIERYSDNPKVQHLVKNSKNSGSAFKQWNRGINLAKGEYVWIAESDDWAELEFLEESVKALNQNPKAGLCVVNSNIVDKYGEIMDSTFNRIFSKKPSYIIQPDGTLEISNDLFLKGYFNGKSVIHNASSVLFKKSFLSSDYSFLKNKNQLGDTFLWVNILLKNGNVLLLNKTLNNFRRHSSALTTKNFLFKRKKVLEEEFELLNFIISQNIIEIDRKLKIDGFKRLIDKYVKFKHNSTLSNKIMPSLKIGGILLKQDFRLYLYLVYKNVLSFASNKIRSIE